MDGDEYLTTLWSSPIAKSGVRFRTFRGAGQFGRVKLGLFDQMMYKLSCQADNKVCLGLAACLLLSSGRAHWGISEISTHHV